MRDPALVYKVENDLGRSLLSVSSLLTQVHPTCTHTHVNTHAHHTQRVAEGKRARHKIDPHKSICGTSKISEVKLGDPSELGFHPSVLPLSAGK